MFQEVNRTVIGRLIEGEYGSEESRRQVARELAAEIQNEDGGETYSLVQYVLSQGVMVEAYLKVKSDSELVATEVEEELRAKYTSALLIMAADTGCSQIVREVLKYNLQGLSAPR